MGKRFLDILRAQFQKSETAKERIGERREKCRLLRSVKKAQNKQIEILFACSQVDGRNAGIWYVLLCSSSSIAVSGITKCFAGENSKNLAYEIPIRII